MAKLTESQMKFRLNRQFKKDDALKQKMEIQQQKEIFGEEWQEARKKQKESEMRDLIATIDSDEEKKRYEEKLNLIKAGGGGILDEDGPKAGFSLPTIYDSIDLTNFFDPVEALKNTYGDDFNFIFSRYEESKQAYEARLKELDKEIYKGVKNPNNSKSKKAKTQKEEKVDEKLEATKKNLFQDIYINFQQYVPIYNTYICSCCGKPLDIGSYYINFDISNLSHLDSTGAVRMSVCKDCAHKLFNYFYNEKAEKDAEKAMKMFCATLNVYWDVNYFNTAMRNMTLNDRKNHIVAEYLGVINNMPSLIGKTFMDSPFLSDKYQADKTRSSKADNKKSEEEQRKMDIDDINAGLFDWSKDDLRNRKQVIKMVGYDVFEYETDKNRKQLYGDLLGMLEPGMEQDAVKLQAAIQIATSFLKIREMNVQYKDMQKNGAPLSDLKILADLKQKEMAAVTKFCQDNGFSERFSTAKGRGENTFTGILNKMNEDKFEDAIANLYDIRTGETIQQAADASFKAIFSQLNMSEGEAWKTIQDQLAELLELRKQVASLKEEVRQAKYEASKAELKMQAMERGIEVDDDD